MDSLYEKNGLIFWNESEIKLRRTMETCFVDGLFNHLKTVNAGFEFIQVEAPLLTPRKFINAGYTEKDIYLLLDEELVLRPETTMGSYAAITHLLNPYNSRRVRLPLVVWQHGKSFRKEQDQATKYMRLKEFYQLEFQIAFSPTTKNDYSTALIPAVQGMISDLIGSCKVVASDRLPDYADWTMDVVCEKSDMEVCSISKRKDFKDMIILEVAIGTDRCVFNFLNKRV